MDGGREGGREGGNERGILILSIERVELSLVFLLHK